MKLLCILLASFPITHDATVAMLSHESVIYNMSPQFKIGLKATLTLGGHQPKRV